MRSSSRIAAALSAALLSAVTCGCAVKYTEPTAPPPQLSEPERNFETLWQASLEVLRRYYFEPQRQDRRAGVITTLPMTGKHYFEWWRKDAARAQDLSESSVQTLYRVARVTIRPADAAGETFGVQVEVLLWRSDKSAQELASTSDAYRLFRSAAAPDKHQRELAAERRKLKPAELADLGNDRALEAKLTADIEHEARRLRRDPGRLDRRVSWPELEQFSPPQWQWPQWQWPAPGGR